MTVAILLLVALVAFLSILALRIRQRKRLLWKALTHLGFREEQNDSEHTIDFGITCQWPEARGIVYVSKFVASNQDCRAIVADVRCWETIGKHLQRRVDQIEHTMVSCEALGGTIPRFRICPRDWKDRFTQLVDDERAFDDLDSAFSTTFHVQGVDVEDLHHILTPELRKQLLSFPELILEAGKQSVILFDQGKVLGTHRIRAYLNIGQQIVHSVTRPPRL